MADQKHNPEPDEIEGTDDPQTAELVAYLDGELPESDADRVEQLLLADPPLRKNAESLDRTWQLLSSLEEATASGEFTQRTLTSIATVSAERDADKGTDRHWSLKKQRAWSLIARGLIWCLAGFMACSAGLFLSRKARPEQTDPTDAQILENLDLYHKYPMLWRIPDVAFLEEISENAETSTVRGEQP